LPENAGPASIALVYDTDVPKAQLMSIKRELVAKGHRVRLEKRVKNMKAMLDRIAGEGFHEFANVRPDTLSANDLDVRSQGDR
ncbi:MAG: histidine--tRNA ligase, partial [Microbacteriaceae bacterium]